MVSIEYPQKKTLLCTLRLPVLSIQYENFVHGLDRISAIRIEEQQRYPVAAIRVIAAQRKLEQATGMRKQWHRSPGIIPNNVAWVSRISICSVHQAKLNQAMPHSDWY